MIEAIKYKEYTKKDAQDRLNYLLQIVKDNPDDYGDYKGEHHICVFTNGEGAPITLSKTAARKYISDCWKYTGSARVGDELPDYLESERYYTKLSLDEYRLWISHDVEQVRTAENLERNAKLDAYRKEVFS